MGLGWWLDVVISEVFSNLDNSMILWFIRSFPSPFFLPVAFLHDSFNLEQVSWVRVCACMRPWSCAWGQERPRAQQLVSARRGP